MKRPLILARVRRRLFGRWPMSRQIASVLVIIMLISAVLIIAGTEVFSYYEVIRVRDSLTPGARHALDMVEKEQLPPRAELLELIRAGQQTSEDLTERGNVVLALLVLGGAIFAAGAGYILLGRLARGLTNVADAAKRVAEGDLSARAEGIRWASREQAGLTLDFNQMAHSLQRAERELAEGTAAIAHELRTPLTILRGRLHGIADGVFTLRAEEVQGLIYQVEGLGRIVDDLQTLSLANSDRMVLEFAPTDLAQEVDRVLATMTPDLVAAGLTPVLTLSPTPLFADGTRIRQAIGAILANAGRYAANSGVLLIETRDDAGEAILEIIDHGPGLADGVGEQAFDRFWRGEGSRGRVTGGSGLGLAVVRAIVEAHGGTATIGNHDGGGAIFTMRLPQRPIR